MLFHLKEPNYKTETPTGIVTRFYGRNPQEILACLDYYIERTKKDGDMESPNLVWWLKRKFSTENIEQIEKGEFYFFTGMISISEENKNKDLFEKIKVSKDFIVNVPEENIGNFALWRMRMIERERGGLYKMQNPIAMFMNLSFVPKDIAEAVVSCDLKPYQKMVEKDMERRRELSQHPNIQIDGLEKTLDAMQRQRGKNN